MSGSGAAGEGLRDLGGLGFLQEEDGGAWLYLGILAALGKSRIGSSNLFSLSPWG
jgi:hypothetical protein